MVRLAPHAAEHQRRARRNPGRERLTQDQHAHQDGAQRPDHASLRGLGCTDALDAHHHHQHRREGAHGGVQQ